MTRRDRKLSLLQGYTEQVFVAKIQAQSQSQFQVVVNGRSTTRPAVSHNELDEYSVGDEVIMITAEGNDAPTIIGHSPWIVHGE